MAGEPVEERVSERALFALTPRRCAAAGSGQAGKRQFQTITVPKPSAVKRWRLPKLSWRTVVRVSTTALALERDRGVAFLLAPPIMIAGVFAYFALPVEPSLAAFGAVAVALALLTYLARERSGLATALTVLLILVVGATCARFETWRASTKMLGSEITTRLTARVVDIDHLANGRIRLTVDVLSHRTAKIAVFAGQGARLRCICARRPGRGLDGRRRGATVSAVRTVATRQL